MSSEYYVYVAKDVDDKVVYVGSGKGARIDHVNSGHSHNPDLNRYVLTTAPFVVEKVFESLSKADSLIHEQLIQDLHKPLYNKNRAIGDSKKPKGKNYGVAIAVLQAEYDILYVRLSRMPPEEECYSSENTDIQGLHMAIRYLESLSNA